MTELIAQLATELYVCHLNPGLKSEGGLIFISTHYH